MRRFRRWSSSSATTSREARRDGAGFSSADGAAAAHRAAGRTGIGLRPYCRDRAYARAWQSQPGRPARRNAVQPQLPKPYDSSKPCAAAPRTLKRARFSSSRSNSSTTRRCSNRPRDSLPKARMRATPGAPRSTRRSRILKRPTMIISVTASATCATCARACWRSWLASSSYRCSCRRMQSCSPTTSRLRASSRRLAAAAGDRPAQRLRHCPRCAACACTARTDGRGRRRRADRRRHIGDPRRCRGHAGAVARRGAARGLCAAPRARRRRARARCASRDAAGSDTGRRARSGAAERFNARGARFHRSGDLRRHRPGTH